MPSRLTFRKAQHVPVTFCTSVCIKGRFVKLSSLSHGSSEFAHLDEAPFRFHKKNLPSSGTRRRIPFSKFDRRFGETLKYGSQPQESSLCSP